MNEANTSMELAELDKRLIALDIGAPDAFPAFLDLLARRGDIITTAAGNPAQRDVFAASAVCGEVLLQKVVQYRQFLLDRQQRMRQTSAYSTTLTISTGER